MPSDRWRQLDQLFSAAMALPASGRAAFIEAAVGVDASVRDELMALLATAEDAGSFLDSTALDVFARQISREGWSVRPGDTIGCYAIERRVGAGGMGEVWRARDERLGRDVAIKLLLPRPADGGEGMSALHAEARAAGMLNHPNVVTVHDIGWHGGAPYLVTEFLDGESLRARFGRGPLPLASALDIAVQVARGLAAAHGRGIVHGDLKPENLFVGGDGRVKILDFGLARLHDQARQGAAGRTTVTGTVGYMAPEQLRGEDTDHRTDVFALGVVVHEMLAGRRPFEADSTVATIERILTARPARLADVDHAIPQAVSDLVDRCLEKDPADRLSSVADAVSILEATIKASQTPAPPSLATVLRRPAVAAAALLAVVASAALVWYWHSAAARLQWARGVAPAEARRLFDHGEYAEAWLLARQALAAAPEDRPLQQLWTDMSIEGQLTTDPAGVDVAIAAYRTRTPSWLPIGRTPLSGVRVPRGPIRIRLSKAGYQTIEVGGTFPRLRYRLDPVSAVPPGMVRVVGGPLVERLGVDGQLDDFWIDRDEVTNAQFQRFVDQGGYRRPELWRDAFVDGARIIPWVEAMARFRDRTGKPGPATWTGGRYPEGEADFPVSGVSWHEASAYAAFVGKSLPTMHHWYRAASMGRFADVLGISNFSGPGPAPVGSFHGLGPFGTEDMAGNVKEWCSTDVGGRRVLLGGAWTEPRYLFMAPDTQSPFARAAQYGLRLARYPGPLSAAVAGPVRLDEDVRDGRTLKPASDEVFAVIRQQYAYDPAPLNAVVESTEAAAEWTRVTVGLDAASGGGRMRVHLFLPRRTAPPYQAIAFFPAHDAFLLRSSRDLSLAQVAFLIRGGRALLYPVYEGTYERATEDPAGANARRERRIAWSRQLGRGLDYLASRPDIDGARLGFYGISDGADAGTLLIALEPRLKASVLQGTGIWGDGTPENNAVDYAPRIHMPTLMLNGRYDFGTVSDARPLFDLLGARPGSKRHVLVEAGHALTIDDAAREVLPWFDRYLGPVSLTPAS